jgi:arsenate reductase
VNQVQAVVNMKNILILCTGNSCRSQIAHGYFATYTSNIANVYSAGIQTHGVNLKAIKTMLADGIDISLHTSNNVNEYLTKDFDYIITVCDHAKENCPYIPSKATRIHHSFPDPAKFVGPEADEEKHFAEVREQIKTFTKNFIAEHFSN